ncbi:MULTISPECIES: hypothetical protein [unclassified Microcoleus]|uniref:hypothetical protein n=1 Tax=unclassified Microcoleus TaxID=2642155 RepID=UPI0025D161D8|nr:MULTISPECIES: hypothetical protein [unclassified Microcoleus]
MQRSTVEPFNFADCQLWNPSTSLTVNCQLSTVNCQLTRLSTVQGWGDKFQQVWLKVDDTPHTKNRIFWLSGSKQDFFPQPGYLA